MSIIVKAQAGQSTDQVIKQFQKRVALEDVVKEYRDKQFHKTESEKRQERRAEKQRKIMRAKRFRD
jgi:ribosomal protein S21